MKNYESPWVESVEESSVEGTWYTTETWLASYNIVAAALVVAISWATVGVGVYLLLPPPSDKK